MSLLDLFRKNPKPNAKLDGINIDTLFRDWETDACTARDRAVDEMLGPSWDGFGSGGMQTLVYAAYLYYMNRHWELPPYLDQTSNPNNVVFPWYQANINNILPIAAPGKIKLTAIPLSSEADNKLFAAQATAIMTEEIEELGLDRETVKILLGAKQHGFQAVHFGHTMTEGMIEPKRTLDVCDPLSILFEPSATSISTSRYVIWKRSRLISEVKDEYDLDFDPKPQSLEAKYSMQAVIQGQTEIASKDRCVETVIFIRDNTTESVPITRTEQGFDEFGNPVESEVYATDEAGNKLYFERKLYPNGRYIIMINDKIIYDNKNPYQHGRCPFTMLLNEEYPGQIWGVPEWMKVGSVQHIMNEAGAANLRVARSSVRKVIIDETQIEGTVDEITTDPGTVLRFSQEHTPGQEWKDELILGGDPSFKYDALLQWVTEIGQLTSGVTNASMGKSDNSVTSGKQQQVLVDESEKRIFVFRNNINNWFIECGYLMLYNAIQFRPQEQTLTISSLVNAKPFKASDFDTTIKFKIAMVPQSGLPSDRQDRLKLLLEIVPTIQALLATNPLMARAIIKASDLPELEDMLMQQEQVQPIQQPQTQPQGIPVIQ